MTMVIMLEGSRRVVPAIPFDILVEVTFDAVAPIRSMLHSPHEINISHKDHCSPDQIVEGHGHLSHQKQKSLSFENNVVMECLLYYIWTLRGSLSSICITQGSFTSRDKHLTKGS